MALCVIFIFHWVNKYSNAYFLIYIRLSFLVAFVNVCQTLCHHTRTHHHYLFSINNNFVFYLSFHSIGSYRQQINLTRAFYISLVFLYAMLFEFMRSVELFCCSRFFWVWCQSINLSYVAYVIIHILYVIISLLHLLQLMHKS